MLGIAVEVTHRSKRRLYGLRHLAPLRAVAAPPRRAPIGRGRGRPVGYAAGIADHGAKQAPLAPIVVPPPLPRAEREAFELGELDRWMAIADQAIRRVQRALEVYAVRQSERAIVLHDECVTP